jgi:hypothetical protein
LAVCRNCPTCTDETGRNRNTREILEYGGIMVMEKLKRLQKKLSASGYNAEFITVYNRNGSGENVPALRIITDYEGQYPPKETYAAISDIKKLCKNHVTECRGFYTAIFIY